MAKINLEEIKNKAVQVVDRDYSYIDGKFLRNFRMELNMSQTLLADYLGVSKKAIEKWEQGKNKINAPVTRLIFLIENDPSILTLLKEVKVSNEVVFFNKNCNFAFNTVENTEEIKDKVSAQEDYRWANGSDWKISSKNKKKGEIGYAF